MKNIKKVLLIILSVICSLTFLSCTDGENKSETPTETTENANQPENNNDEQPIEPENVPTTEDATFIYHTENGCAVIDGVYNKSVSELKIPEKINGLSVVKIIDRAFINITSLNKIVFPDSIINFGYGILGGCYNLEKLRVPFIGSMPQENDALYTSNFGYIFGSEKHPYSTPTTQYFFNGSKDYVDSEDYYIPDSLDTVYIGGANKPIPYAAFYNCGKIKKFVIEKNVSKIYEFAFSGCYGEIVFDEPTIKTIDEYAFSDYKGYDFQIPKSVETIKTYAFEDCEHLTEIIIPENIKTIEPFAFRGCFDAKSITINADITEIPSNCFYFNIKLEKINIPKSVKKIDNQAFMGCKELKEITLPENVNFIGKNCFKTCPKLAYVYFEKFTDWQYYNDSKSVGKINSVSFYSSKNAANCLKNTYCDYYLKRF